MRLTNKQIKLLQEKSKYNNIKTVIDGIIFDSKRESERYCELLILIKAKTIKDLELQPKFVLQDGFKKNGVTYRAITYKADFKYVDVATGKTIIEDVKGVETKEFRLKRKLFEYKYKSLELTIIK